MKEATKGLFNYAKSDLLLIREINSNENQTHLSAFIYNSPIRILSKRLSKNLISLL
jgi:hypothetical protein